ncbi:type I restriction enzyme HsdR N-terminal domain-containing protein [Algoriphagus namhaensis]
MESRDERITLPTLKLPRIMPKLSEKEDGLYIWDDLRKKHLVLTPEEWVRQHWIQFLITHLNFPKGLISLEKGLKYNKLQKRTDVLVLDKTGSPYLLIECKAPTIKLSQKTMEQAAVYHQSLKSPHLILSNGNQHICLHWNESQKSFEQTNKFPTTPK